MLERDIHAWISLYHIDDHGENDLMSRRLSRVVCEMRNGRWQ